MALFGHKLCTYMTWDENQGWFKQNKSNVHYQIVVKKQLPTFLATEMAIKGTGVNEAIAVVLKAAKAVAGIKDQLSKVQVVRKCH